MLNADGERGRRMTTRQLTYNQDTDTWCYGIWVEGKFITRACGGSDKKDEIIRQFEDELKIN